MTKKDKIKKKIYGDKIIFTNFNVKDVDDEVIELQIRRLKANELNTLLKDLTNGQPLEEIQKNEEKMQEFLSGLIKTLVYADNVKLFEDDDEVLELDAMIYTQIANSIMNFLNFA